MSGLYIVLVVVTAIILVAVTIIAYKKSSTHAYVSWVVKKHPKQLAVLLGHPSASVNDLSFTKEENKKILAISKAEWKHWGELVDDVKVIARKHTITFDDYVLNEFSHLRNRFSSSLFIKSNNKRELYVEAMTIAELGMVVAETEENWNERRIRNQKASEIKSKNIEGYKIYCDIRNISIPSSIDILRDKVTIEYYQKSYERSKIYEGWEDKQKAFCKKYHDLCSKHRDCDGRFTYEVNYSHITKTGSTSLSKFKIWQGFINSFSFDNEEMQPDYMIATKNNLPKFKDKKRFFVKRVYQGIYEIIDGLLQEHELVTLVVFVNSSKYDWPKATYQYHYKEIKSLLDANGYDYCNLEELHEIKSTKQYDVVILMDAITNSEDLKNNCRLIAEYFSKNVPMIGYYTWIKEYSADEVLRFCKKSTPVVAKPAPAAPTKPIDTEASDIAFVKDLFSKVRKHSYFSYIAITNTLIGEAGGANETKPKWLSKPLAYVIKCERCDESRIEVAYSVNGGITYDDLKFDSDAFSIDDVAWFTYRLFQIMGVWEEFKNKGQKAIDHMNYRGFLASH